MKNRGLQMADVLADIKRIKRTIRDQQLIKTKDRECLIRDINKYSHLMTSEEISHLERLKLHMEHFDKAALEIDRELERILDAAKQSDNEGLSAIRQSYFAVEKKMIALMEEERSGQKLYGHVLGSITQIILRLLENSKTGIKTSYHHPH